MPVWADVIEKAKADGLRGVRLCGSEYTTLDLPHKRFQSGPTIYFVCQLPEGDYALHNWTARNQEGYARGMVSFLMEDGTVQTVRGPFYGSNMWDFGDAQKLKDATGYDASAIATKLKFGQGLSRYTSAEAEYVYCEESGWVLGDPEPRILQTIEANKMAWPDRFDVMIQYRSGNQIASYPAHFCEQKKEADHA